MRVLGGEDEASLEGRFDWGRYDAHHREAGGTRWAPLYRLEGQSEGLIFVMSEKKLQKLLETTPKAAAVRAAHARARDRVATATGARARAAARKSPARLRGGAVRAEGSVRLRGGVVRAEGSVRREGGFSSARQPTRGAPSRP
eukprot:3770393-Prymnesium_polylepis.1